MAKTIVEELVGILGLDIDKQSFDKGSKSLANLKNQYERVASAAQKFAVAGAALAGFTVITNKLTAEQENLAAAVGLSGQTLDAYGAIAKQAGLDTEKVIDIAEELNNKIGESKGIEQITAVKEAFSILGLEFEKISKLNPEEQLFAVIDAASKLEDQQKAVAATDILLGGDANRLTGFIRSQDESLRELLDTQIRLNLLTQKSRDEAKAFNKSFGQLSVIIGSATKQLAALLGKGLKPVIDFIVEWVAENKELSQSIIKVFSFVLPAALAVAGIAVAAMTAKLIAMGLAVLASTWPIIAITAAIAAIGIAIGLIVEDIVTFIKHGTEADTMLGSLLMTAKELFDAFANTKIGGAIVDGIDAAHNAIKTLIDYGFKAYTIIEDFFKKFKEWGSFDFESFFSFDNAIQQLKNLLNLVNKIGGAIVDGIVTFIKHGAEADTMLGSLLATAKELFDAFLNTKIGGAIVDGVDAAHNAIKTLIDYGFKAYTIIEDFFKKFKEWGSFDFESFFSFDNAIQQLENLLSLVNNIGNIIGEKLGIFPLIRRITGGQNSGEAKGEAKGERNSPFLGQSLQTAPISPVSQVSTNNNSNVNQYNINIDATGMDSEQLNRAIDSRVGQQNALAASANSTGIVR